MTTHGFTSCIEWNGLLGISIHLTEDISTISGIGSGNPLSSGLTVTLASSNSTTQHSTCTVGTKPDGTMTLVRHHLERTTLKVQQLTMEPTTGMNLGKNLTQTMAMTGPSPQAKS